MIAAPPPAFHVNLGDLPTWLGVLAASAAAIFVYRQLRSQNKEIKRQVAALERQQANDIELFVSFGRTILFLIALPGLAIPRDNQLVLVVKNASRRPIRRVSCEVRPDSNAVLRPTLIGLAEEHLEADRSQNYTVWNPAPKPQASLMAAGELRAFVFECDFADGLTYKAEFTDDADHVWRIDQDLHLQPIEPPRTGWLARLRPGTRKSLGNRESGAV